MAPRIVENPVDNFLEEIMGNYPDGTWQGDPRAPWNQDPDECEDGDGEAES